MNRFLTGQFYLNTILAIIGIFNSFQVSAQVIPDNTLGSENSTVNRNSSGGDVIDGGAIRGSNLFHSFEKFSIPNGGSVLFNNTTNIQNIINRVTGGSVSDINGLISANGTANLFLVNPNGITFGTEAALNIGGSFFATTASGVRFSDGSIFSANSTQSSPLLTVSTPIGLQLGTRENIKNSDSGNIIVNSLSIQNAATLNLLAANNLEINNANLQLPSGRLGIILEADSDKSGQGNIKTMDSTIQTNGGVLSLTAAKEISLNNTMLKSDNNSNNPARDITLKADDISFNNDTSIQSQTFSSGNAATANIDANTLTIEGGGINNISQGSGNTGLINISADNISLTNGASLLTETQGEGNARDINIAVTNNFNITGISIDNNSTIRSIVTKESLGKTGNINISANNLSLDKGVILNQDNSQIDNQPQNSKINGSINIDSKSINAKNSSLILAFIFSNGKGGDININKNIKTGSLRYENGGGIIARTGDEQNSGRGGDAGDINITADSVSLIGGGVSNSSVGIGSQTFNNGNAGNLNISLAASLLIENTSGIDTNSLSNNSQATGKAGNIDITAESITLKDRGGIGSNTLTAGKGGNITIKSGVVTLQDKKNTRDENNPFSRSNISANTGIAPRSTGARIVREATGQAGIIDIKADKISLDNAEITAQTANTNGGNIILNIDKNNGRVLLLRNGSNISTTVGIDNSQAPGNGGNIRIKTPFIVTLKNENSDITANADLGAGGTIEIDAKRIFGIAVSPILTTGNDITAFSQLDPSLNGIITINISGIDPSQGLVELPLSLTDSSQQVAQACNSIGSQNKLVYTGRGGLTPSPNDPLGGEVIWEDMRIDIGGREKVDREIINRESRKQSKNSKNSAISSPATGWVFNSKGEVTFISQSGLMQNIHSVEAKGCLPLH
jgi:filamentous hemagglutinin family protein